MNLTSNYLPLLSLVIGVSANFAAYGADAPAGEQVVQEPVAIAPTPIAVPPAIEKPVNTTPVPANPSATTPATTPEAVEKKPEAAPKPVLSEKEQKKLRDEIIYRTSLGRASDVKILLEQGASVDETNQSGVPLISLASSRTDAQGIDVVKTLLEAKADINKVDSRGRNALFYAAKSGNRKTVEYLLAKNIKYAAVDSAGYNARVIAYQTGNNEIVEILDGFVRGQNEAIRKQYDEANKEIAEKYK
ncbi:MAG: ankyrin repeat domain-containing protein, partial [Rickettsiales bacterium]